MGRRQLSLAQLIGLHLQRERVARGYTQRRFAEEFGVSQSWLAKVELGQSRTSIQRVCELFAAFELQLRVEVEPIGADLDDELSKYHRMSAEDRDDIVRYFDRHVRLLDGLRLPLSGRFGVDELRMHVTKEAPRSVVVKLGDRDVRVVPLADLELMFPDIRR
jgi:transcriptional regulator with XRE-family HTH domain